MDTSRNKKTSEKTQSRKKYFIKTQFTEKYKGTYDSIQKGKSLTEPDMSLTIPELLHNHSRGFSSEISLGEPQYFDTEIPIFKDLTERQEYIDDLEKQSQEINLQIAADKAHAKEQHELKEKLAAQQHEEIKNKILQEHADELKRKTDTQT